MHVPFKRLYITASGISMIVAIACAPFIPIGLGRHMTAKTMFGTCYLYITSAWFVIIVFLAFFFISSTRNHAKSWSLTRQSVNPPITATLVTSLYLCYCNRLTIDVFGTCVDWRSCIEKALEEAIDATPAPDYAALAHKWRNGKIGNLHGNAVYIYKQRYC